MGAYEGVLRDLIHAMKFGGRRTLAHRLGDLLAHAGRDLVAGADVSVPVPLHCTRLWARGYNQSADLAARLPLPVLHALRRRRRTGAQSALDADARTANVSGAFALSRWGCWRGGIRKPWIRTRPLAGLTVVLVDDVSTTGATLEACACVLRDAGAREVRALTVARTLRTR